MKNNMQTILILKGVPASAKSTYCRELMAKEVGQWRRINNDDLRTACDFGVYSPENEKTIRKMRDFLLKEYLTAGFNVIHDNVNASKKNYDEVISVVNKLNLDVEVREVPFFIELDEAVERDSQREGKAKVGKEVIEKFWKMLGGKNFKNYVPRQDIFYKRDRAVDRFVEPLVQDESKDRAIIVDLDGTLAKIGNRSPYSAENCDLVDSPNDYVVKTVELYYRAGYKIIFCSGRMEKDRAPTMRFINKYLPDVEYRLFMRRDDDFRKDYVIKEEIFNNNIKDKFWVNLVIDDRLSVCQLWFRLGLNLLRAGDPDSDF
jgi:predicted kinase